MIAPSKYQNRVSPFLRCIDAGSEFCPCYLADLGECVMCPVLCGKDNCDCDWSGTCIFQEYQWCKAGTRSHRESVDAEILEKTIIRKGLLTVRLHVGRSMSGKLHYPGSFVFLRRGGDSSFFDTPIAVMHAHDRKGEIQVAFSVVGPKTKRLESCARSITVRGPYWNGIFGHRYIEGTRNSSCLVVLDGIAQASGLLVVKRMLRGGNSVAVFLGASEFHFIRDLLPDTVKVYGADFRTSKGKACLSSLINQLKPACIFSGGGHCQHSLIRSMLSDMGSDSFLAISNNSRMCCGEGICGGCAMVIEGKCIRTCKACLDPGTVLDRYLP